ncbi:unnamed protein product [Symbiodinium sp. CCMP2456]|nr:unnamed protein product [Symbiodinium sp. CCMP2456]
MWLVGVGLVLAGLLVGTGGMHLIRASELKTQSGHISQGRTCYAVGILLNVVVGPILDMSGYAFAPASVVAPFTGFNVIINALVAPLTLGEQLTPCRCKGIIAVFVTATLSVLFKGTPTPEWSVEDAQNLLTQWHIYLYIVVFALWLLGNLRVLAFAAHGSVLRGFCLGAISGSLAGNMWCTRLLAVFLKECFEGNCRTTWSTSLPYTMAAGAVFFAITNVPFMTRGMRQYEALFMITVFQGASILSNSLSAVIVLEEMDGEPLWKVTGYFLCVGGMILGLLVLMLGEEDSSKPSHSQLEPMPVEDVLEDTSFSNSNSDSAPRTFMEFLHAGAKSLFQQVASCRQSSEDGSMHETVQSVSSLHAVAPEMPYDGICLMV